MVGTSELQLNSQKHSWQTGLGLGSKGDRTVLWAWVLNLWNLILSPSGWCQYWVEFSDTLLMVSESCLLIWESLHLPTPQTHITFGECREGSESHSVVFDSLRPRGLYIYSPWNSPGQNTGVGSCSLLQGIFPTWGSNPGLPHCVQILYRLSHQGSPYLWKFCIIIMNSSLISGSYTFPVRWELGMKVFKWELTTKKEHKTIFPLLVFK